MNLSPLPVQKFFDNNGAPLVNGLLFTYAAGTTTKIGTAKDQAGTANTNPIQLDYRGEANVWLDQTLTYKFTLAPAGDTDPPTKPIWTVDNISAAVTFASLTRQILGQILYPRTQAEITASVVPTNYAVPSHDVLGYADLARYGLTDTNTDQHSVVQSGVNVMSVAGGGKVVANAQLINAINLGTTGVAVPADVIVSGNALEKTVFTYSGTGYAFDFTGGGNGLMDCYSISTAAAGNGVRFSNDCRRLLLRRCTIQNSFAPASGRTGTGIFFQTTSAATTFSGDSLLEHCYSLGFKFGMDFDCFNLGVNTWTSIVGEQTFLIGPGAGVVAGSRGIRMSATTNGVGTSFFGGTIELFEAPIEIADGGFGLNYYGDIEGNTSNVPILGASWCGEIVTHPAGTVYRGGSNNSTNPWYRERNLNGEWSREVWTNHYFDIYDSGNAATVTIGRGASRIGGGSPSTKWQFTTGNSGADNGPNRNYLQGPNGSRMYFGPGSPETVVTANPGSWYGRDNGGAGTGFYVKESGVGNVGWIAK